MSEDPEGRRKIVATFRWDDEWYYDCDVAGLEVRDRVMEALAGVAVMLDQTVGDPLQFTEQEWNG